MAGKRASPTRLLRLLERLQVAFGPIAAPPPRTSFEHALWENVAYLANDVRRAQAYAALAKATSLQAEGVLAVSERELTAVCRLGGPFAEKRAGRLQECARIWLQEGAGDEARMLAGPVDAAVRRLAKFPAIGRPGAQRILMLTGAAPVLGLDSNALRSLLRLGYGVEDKRYEASYRSAQAAATCELPANAAVCSRTYLLLRELGRRVCTRSRPRCVECPVAEDCPSRGA